MANCDNLFKEFNDNLKVPNSKMERLMKSRDNIRNRITKKFEEDHPDYKPKFYIQGSYKTNTMIRTKDDTCDLDDGVHFKSNPDNVTGTTLQGWVKEAVTGITDATPSHRKKCITVDYAADYNIDLPVLLFDKDADEHPKLAVKDGDWQEDDPKEFVEYFNDKKDDKGQLVRLVKYLKAWCDYKRDKMPSGLAMTALTMESYLPNDRDDIALKFLLIEIEKKVKSKFQCLVPTTPKDDIFESYSDTRKNNFLTHLSDFVADARKAVDEEKNQLQASKLWQKHLGKLRFPEGKDEVEKAAAAVSLAGVIGSSRPYYGA